MGKYLKIQDWTVNFLEIDRIEKNRIILHSGREIILSKEEKTKLESACRVAGLPNLFP